jgi:hypothetical protein
VVTLILASPVSFFCCTFVTDLKKQKKEPKKNKKASRHYNSIVRTKAAGSY